MFAVLVATALLAQTPIGTGEAFVQALVEDEPGAMRALAAGSDSDLSLVIDAVEKYECVAVRHHAVMVERATETTATVRVSLDGTAVTNGAIRREAALPSRWRLELARASDGWHITSAVPEEKVFADELIAASETERGCLLATRPELDLVLLTQQMAYDTAVPAYAASDRGAMAFVDALAASLESPTVELYVLRMEAILAAFRNDPDRAASLATEGIVRARALGDPEAIAACEFEMGIVSWFAGRTDLALRHLEESAKFVDSVADPRLPIQSLYMEALISGRAGRLRRSLSAVDRVQALSTKWGWEEGRIVAALQRGAVHLQLGDVGGARAYSWDAYELARRANNVLFASYALHNTVSEATSDVTEEDVTTVKRAMELTVAGEAMASMQSTLVDLLTTLGRTEEAEAVLRQAERAPSPYADVLTLARARLLLRQKRDVEALEELRKPNRPAAPGMDTIDYRETSMRREALKGRALRDLGRTAEAVVAFESSIALVEERRSEVEGDPAVGSMFLTGKAEPYYELMDILLDEGRVEDALLLGERLRARALRDVLEQGRVDISQSMSEEEKGEEAKLTKDVVDLNRRVLAGEGGEDLPGLRTRLAEARSALSRFDAELVIRHPDLRPRRGESMTTTARLGDLLPGDDATALVYSVHDEHTHVFVVRRTAHGVAVDVRSIAVGRKDLAGEVSDFIDALARRDLRFGEASRSLYDLLVAPVERELGGSRTVCVVPDGPLWHLPFQVLRTRSGKYLVESAAVFLAPSLSLLRPPAPRAAPAAPRLLAFGNATFGAGRPAFFRGRSLASLPDAEREVESIGALYGASSRIFLRGEARESAAKELAGSYDVLHFATHAVADDAAPLYSSLVLAGSPVEDGLLEAREILDLQLHADLAILSACETARGPVRTGEGLIGMSWALMAAGCPNTVVSEWSVGSASTAELMIEFHRQLRRTPAVSKAEALRRAQLHLLRGRYRHPFYWSPFVLIGNGW
jgi:CHAT domain-containing protein/tetratricopeptide (TPR) repeat protein